MGGPSIIDGKRISGQMAIYCGESSHLCAGGGVWAWPPADVHDTQYSLTKGFRTFVSRYAHAVLQQPTYIASERAEER